MALNSEYMAATGKILMENDVVVNLANRYANITKDFEQLVVGATATVLTPAKYAGSVKAIITVEGNGLRFRTDGTNPTASVGLMALNGSVIELDSPDEISNFSCISSDGTSVTLNIEYKG